MSKPPLILISPSVEKRGVEFHDLSISLSMRYEEAILAAGGIPVILPASPDRNVIAEAVRRTDGVLITGGDDIYPALYHRKLPRNLLNTIEKSPCQGKRDKWEVTLIEEVFRQRKPVLGICRGHQMLNVAFGGQLVADIRQEIPGAINHQRMDQAAEIVHEVALTPGSLVSKICKTRVLGVNSTHHQAVVLPAEPFVATAISKDGLVEAMELKPELADRMPFLLSVQFHPERLVQKHARYRAIFRTFVGACGKN